jgi:putative transposase
MTTEGHGLDSYQQTALIHNCIHIHRRSWKCLQEVELATLDWVNWYNHRRLLSSISNVPPAEAEAAYDRQQVALPKAA